MYSIKGRLAIGIRGFGLDKVRGRILFPLPPAIKTAFITFITQPITVFISLYCYYVIHDTYMVW